MMTTPLQILLIEDDEAYAGLVRRMLRTSGSELVVAERMEAALKQLAGRTFDVVLSDLNLPDSRGIETFQRVMAAAPKLPIVVLTGENDDALGLRTVQSGAQDYLVKDHVEPALLFRSLTYAIERKRMQLEAARVADELKKQNEVMQADLRMAREVQTAMLPFGASRSNGRVSFTHRYLPAGPVGGDFFTEFCSEKGQCAAVLYDVMGHGVRAALVTGLLRALADESSVLSLGPERFLTQLNRNLRSIFGKADQQIFVTALCVVADPLEQQVYFASAGHPNPVLIDAGSGTASQVETKRGPPLGLVDEGTWVKQSAPFAAGNRLLMFTDGLYEVEGTDGSQYGTARLAEAARHKAGLPATKLLAELIEEAQEFSTSGDFNDDVCAILLEPELGKPRE
ncbi:MAG: fused response regulator/phosphatase [Myxococcaceae bacterium]|nr:fused response regulator/phosphatase [Myxococcaceae bacterium]